MEFYRIVNWTESYLFFAMFKCRKNNSVISYLDNIVNSWMKKYVCEYYKHCQQMNVVQDEELVGDNIARLLLLRQQARILACTIHCSSSAVSLIAVVGAGTKTCTQRQATLTAAQMAGSFFFALLVMVLWIVWIGGGVILTTVWIKVIYLAEA